VTDEVFDNAPEAGEGADAPQPADAVVAAGTTDPVGSPDPVPPADGRALPPVPPDEPAQASPFAPADGLPPVPRRPGREAVPPPEPVAGPPAAASGHGPRVARVLAITLLSLVALGALVTAAGWWYLYGRPGRVPAGQVVTVTVAPGDSVPKIAKELERAGVVRTALGFELLVRTIGAGDTFQSGTYRLKTGMAGDEVVAALEVGHGAEESVVTIPEGFSVRQVAARLKAKAGIDATEFTRIALTQGDTFKAKYPFLTSNHTKSLEGYLFPKTYSIRQGAAPREVIESMLTQFGQDTADIDMRYARSKNLTLNDVVTIASIIERESMFKSDQPLVASVLYNRLHAHMRLGLDTTIIYALGLETKSRVYLRDLQVDSPYNTYRNDGLPPGAICNPGIEALKAAAHPTQTDYLYFLALGKDGKLTFTKTDADFQKAKARMVR
jgi:UPF0755 protein